MARRKALFAGTAFGVLVLAALVGIVVVTTGLPTKPKALNNRPIIGVLAQENEFEHYGFRNGSQTSYIAASYIKFVELGGGQAVPILVNQPEEYYKNLFKKINGVLFPGGDANITTGQYADAAKILYKLALEANANGDHFPLFGICLGFELLTALTAGRDTLTRCNSNDVALPLEFTPRADSSRLLGHLPHDVKEYLTTKDVTVNYHDWCATEENFTSSGLSDFYYVLSKNKDSNGLEFISTIEAKHYPFYGVQWHPEKNNFEWLGVKKIPHTSEAIRINQYMASFFIDSARLSNHRFETTKEENKYLIYNYQPIFSAPNSGFTEIYLFPFQTMSGVSTLDISKYVILTRAAIILK